MTGHIVGLDPMTGMIVVLRKGRDGKAVRRVDVLTRHECGLLIRELDLALSAANVHHHGGTPHTGTPIVTAAPEPEQASFDLDHLTEGTTP